MVDKVFDFRNGQVKEYLFGIDDYLAEVKAGNFREVEKGFEPEVKVAKKVEVKVEEPKNELSFEDAKEQKRLKNKLSRIETEITDLETKVVAIETKMAEGNQSQKELDDYQNAQKDLENKMKEWEEVSEQII